MLAVLGTSAVCGTFTGTVDDDSVGFGLPSLGDGRWWTFLVGALVVPTASLLPVACGLVAVCSGALERRIGWWRTALTVEDNPLPEMGFTLGGVREALDPHVRTHVAVDPEGRVHGVTTGLPVHRDGRVVGWTLDLMRRRGDGFRPVMEFLIAESALAFRDEGYETASLSVAPLARRTAGSTGVLDRVLDSTSTLLEPTYGFRSLLGFTSKFAPTYRPVHLAYPSGLDLPLISLAIGRTYLPDLTVGQPGHLAGGIGRPALARAGRSGARAVARLRAQRV